MAMVTTERMLIFPVSNEELQVIIGNEPDEEMKKAYSEMLAGCIKMPQQHIWYTVWLIGLATEAVTAMAKWAITQPNVLRVEAEAEPNNIASQRVLQKSGFAPNGIIGEEGPRFVWNQQV